MLQPFQKEHSIPGLLAYVKIGTDKNSENRLTSIESEAFADCTTLSLLELYTNNPIVDNITISQSAFNNTNLTIGLSNLKDSVTIMSVSEDEYVSQSNAGSGGDPMLCT